MRWSKYFLPTLRQDPKDSEAISHKLMVRAGLIRRLGSGAYSYLPFGMRALLKAAAIVREEMNRAGAQELLMPALHPIELWKTTGRDAVLGDVLIRFKDRTGKEVALGPTHEEVVTDLVKELNSHKSLPVTVYQIQTKFRDEPRPRFGVLRSKEFIMKDAYSFDTDAQGLNRSYQAMYEAYEKIFSRCGLNVLACEAHSGAMGGDVSHEFMAPSDHGEDRVVRCSTCGYAANLEAAACLKPSDASAASGEPAVEAVATPAHHTVEQVSRFLKVSPSQVIKTLLYDVDQGHVAVLVRGDHDVNEAKLARVLGAASLQLSSPETIQRLSGAPVGFTGPVGLKGVRLIADHAVMALHDAVTGANQVDTHLVHVSVGRDFKPDTTEDVRFVNESDACPRCQKPTIEFVKTIEVGHVFKLGTKYSQALSALFQDPGGSLHPMIMGCYGIGVNRILAAAIEQHHDAQGIIWPRALAPFQVVITVMEAKNPDPMRVGVQAYEALTAKGLEVLLDDRDQSPGSKLKDADLIGIPIRVVIGKAWQKEGKLELRLRSNASPQLIDPTSLPETVNALLAS